MRNITFLSSFLAAVIWLFCYLLVQAPVAVLIVLVAAVGGIIASTFLHNKTEISK